MPKYRDKQLVCFLMTYICLISAYYRILKGKLTQLILGIENFIGGSAFLLAYSRIKSYYRHFHN